MNDRTATILNVNDDDAVRYGITRAFQRAGYQVLEAGSAEEALQHLKGKPDLVLLDVHLPDGHGFEVCRDLKARMEPEWLPILFLSAVYVREEDQVAGMECGADGYLILPSDPAVLISTVRSVLRAKLAEERLRRANSELEQVVQERTEELALANAALRESQLGYRFQADLLEAVGQAVIATDLDGDILYWNRVAEELYGWRAREVLGKSISVIIPEEEAARAGDVMEQLRQGRRWTGEFRVRHRNGQVFPTLVTDSPMYEPSGELSAIIGVSVDITDRTRMEEALRQSETRFRVIFNDADVGMALTDLDGRPTRTNRALQEMLGYSAEELRGMTFQEFTHPGDLDLDRRMMLEVLQGKRDSYRLEKRYVRKDGQIVWGRLLVTLIRQEDGAPWFFIGMVENTTERKQLEAQFHHAQKMEAIGRLAGGVAHDMNNLLCVITGFCELTMQRVPADSPARDGLSQVHLAADRASALTRQLLAFSRKQVLNPQVVDLNEQIGSLGRMLRRLIGEDVELVTELDAALPLAKVDPGQFDQVLMNLAVNARDAMPRGGRLEIRTERVDMADSSSGRVPPGQYARVAISDTGVGISPDVLERIWEPFFTTKPDGLGTGLGLASVYGIIRQSGGYAEVESEEGAGSTFRVYLPAALDEMLPLPTPQPEPAPGGAETVLVCEDEPMVRTLVRTILEARGYQVLDAADGETALRLAGEHPGAIRVLVSDIVMPGGMTGPELAERLRQRRPEMKVLLMSGYPGENLPALEIESGYIPLLQKPFNADLLSAKVREVLDGA